MEKYLDKKGVKFEDERLNCAINITSLAKGGKEKMDFLIDNLTSEAIRIIDSKQNVISVPIKNGYVMECLLDDEMDSSFNKTIFFISLIKDDISYDYCFNLYYFHDKCYLSNVICSYNETKKIFNKNGECISQDPLDDKDIEFSLISRVKKGIFEFQGLTTIFNFDHDKSKKRYLNVESLLSEFRKELKCREYYQCKDREIYKLHYPNKYKFYTCDEIQLKAAEYHDLICEAMDLCYMIGHCGDRFEYDRLLDDYNYVCKQLLEFDVSKISNDCFLYENWCGLNEIECYSPLTYKEWKKLNSNKVTVMEELPNSSSYKYDSYNNYENESEDREIIKKNNIR